jgi:purine nucleosidase
MGNKNYKRIFFSHDGAIDDLIALALVAMAPGVELAGVSLVNGDCLAEQTLIAQAKLLKLAGREDIAYSLSGARAFNAFPWEYRGDCVRFLDLPTIAATDVSPPQLPYPDGERHLAEALRRSEERSLILLVTGPLTPLPLVLAAEPALESKIDRIVWMGGAIDAPGNLDPATLPPAVVNPFAEWNAYWDPFAVDWVFRNTRVPITLAPLDVSDSAAIAPDFLERLQSCATPLAQLAAQAYAMVADQPFYRLWDVVAACAALAPEVFEPAVPMRLAVETWGPQQGRVRRDDRGRAVDVLMELRAAAFFDFVAAELSRGGAQPLIQPPPSTTSPR